MKKWLSLAICVAMILGLTAGVSAFATSDPIIINAYRVNTTLTGLGQEAYEKAVTDAFLADTGINLKFNFVTSTNQDTLSMMSLKIAAGELDFFYADAGYSYYEFVSKGMLMPLNDLLDQYGKDLVEITNTSGSPLLWNSVTFDGSIYMIPTVQALPWYVGTWLRMDLLRKYGINDVPKNTLELVDAMRTVMANEPDIIGMGSQYVNWTWDHGPMAYYLSTPEHVQTAVTPEGHIERAFHVGTGQFHFDSPNLVDYLTNAQKWYAEGIINKEIWTLDATQIDNLVSQDRLVVLVEGWPFQRTADRKAGIDPEYPLAEGVQPQEWILLSNLLNAYGDPTTWSYPEARAGAKMGIISTTKYGPEIMQFLNWSFATEDNQLLVAQGVEGVDYKYNERNKIVSVLDEGGNVIRNSVYNFTGGARPEWMNGLTQDFFGTEWLKVINDCTIWWSEQEAVGFTFLSSDTVRDQELTDIAKEYFVGIVTGTYGVEEGIEQAQKDLYDAGWQEFLDEYEAQYLPAYNAFFGK